MSDVYLKFYANALSLFTRNNTFLQQSNPLAHKFDSTTDEVIPNLEVRFLQRDSLYKNIDVSDIHDDTLWLPLDETLVGHGLFRKGTITNKEVNRFLEEAHSFYQESLGYLIKKINKNSLDTEFWRNAYWVDYFKRKDGKWTDFQIFLSKYKQIWNLKLNEEDFVYEQFCNFKATIVLPNDSLHDAKLE